jgi:hypothetical protein
MVKETPVTSRLLERVFIVLALLTLWLIPLTASAHEKVNAGSYHLEVGWVKEPVIVGERNGLDLFIAQSAGEQVQATATTEHDHDADTTEASQEAGVTGAESTLKFTVEYGSASQSYDLVPVEDKPGYYTADFIPTREGQYTFHLTGAINGEAVEVKVEPEEVVSAGKLAFPEPLESPGNSTGPRTAALNGGRTTQIIAIGGLLLGLIGTGLGVFSLMKKK